MSKEKPTEQAGVSPRSGTAPPKANQFGQPNANPRNDGSWTKTDTPRYKLEQMMKLGKAELQTVIDSDDSPVFEMKLAQALQGGNWKEIESMINQVYGAPKQTQDLNVKELPKPLFGGKSVEG